MSEFLIKRAQRVGVKLKIFLAGPSGSGKTKGALWLARAFVGPQGRICVIDTERESASFYAGEPGIGTFDTIALGAPYHTDRFIAALNAVVDAGYDFCIIDSITHQWSGVGGVLERKEQMDARGGNNFTTWAKFTPETEKFRNALLEAGIHLIATVRSKQEYVIGDGDGGGKKSQVKKMGMKPEQREGLEYEFGIGWQLQMDNRAEALKDRTGLFSGKLVDLHDPKVAGTLRAWVESGAPDVEGDQRRAERAAAQDEVRSAAAAEAKPATAPPDTTVVGACDACRETKPIRDGICIDCRELAEAKALPLKGKPTSWEYKGVFYGTKPIGECPPSVLKQARHFFKDLAQKDEAAGVPEKRWIPDQTEAISLVLAHLETEQGALEFPSAVGDDAAGSGAPAENPTVLKPGKVEDALDKPEGEQGQGPTRRGSSGTRGSRAAATKTSSASTEASATGTATLEAPPASIGALSRRIADLLSHEKFTDDERLQFRKKLDAAADVVAMQALVGELEDFIDQPF